ncbi:MAG: aminodeoxychorismate synthase component I [Thiohalocapsa sp. PB-PSB1]|jgi:para-aminobenzoate synthetase component 1|nr:MAG: aminodeoxychorismate synthase component I [Thiohalocapsa sp. PB-PSB1]HCS90674.1 aminodeoxychorismate synthase component I [Chromatiaceae bacterium]
MASMPIIVELPYHADSELLFEPIAHRPWAVFLDSGRPRCAQGRYDLLAADPYLTLVTRGGQTEIRSQHRCRLSMQDPFALLREQLGGVGEAVSDLPFCGGAIGWFGYDLGRRIEPLPVLAKDVEQIPDMAIGLYDWALIVDHLERRTRLVSACRDPSTLGRWQDLIDLFSVTPVRPRQWTFRVHASAHANMTRAEYHAAFRRIQHYIRNGDCYQVNLAQRFAAPAGGDPWYGYRELRRLNPAPFSAYLVTPYAQVLSSSPERFLKLRAGHVETSPIKGTRPRGQCPDSDALLAMELSRSAKDRAENLMIVDLLRNDLGRVCIPGSIRVPRLFALESYAGVHHLVSTITGNLRSEQDATSLLRACFPGGSITGAPKIRAMQIIEALEPHRRGIYCGAIGYIGFDGAMDSSIAIRTLVYSDAVIRCWAGGGIVHDSDADAEYQETFDKAHAMLRLLESKESADVLTMHHPRARSNRSLRQISTRSLPR